MIHRLKREGIIYVLIFCINQILVAGVNPFGIALAASAICSGYKVLPVFIMTIMGNALIYANNFFSNVIILLVFCLFEFTLNKYGRKFNYFIKTVIFMVIYAAVRISVEYQDLSFINMLVLILEIVIASASCLVFSVGVSYIVNKDITKEMNMQEKISVSLIVTLLGVYIIQVRKNNVTPLKIVVLYILSFIGVLVYKAIVSIRREKQFKYGQVYNNLVYNKLTAYAEAIRNMSKSIRIISNDNKQINNEQGNIIFEKLSEKYCSTCDRCSYCWDKEFETTYEAANIMMSIGVENGILTLQDIPKSFMIRCKKTKEMIETTNLNLELARNNIWWQQKVNELKDIMSMQLQELSSTIKHFSQNMYNDVYMDNKIERKIKYVLKSMGVYVRDLYCYEYKGVKELIMTVKTYGDKVKTTEIAAEISNVLYEKYKPGEYAPRLVSKKIVEINLIKEERYNIYSTCYSIKKDGEKYCGDNYAIVEEDISDTVLILSDGMGSGKEAYKESKKTVEMIEELLTVGFSKEVAVNLVNSSMYLNCTDNKYATLDMCIINRYTGICEFVKVGASSTFIKRGCEVYEITSDTLPIGIFRSMEYEDNKLEMCDGDIIIMMTDGLGDSMSMGVDWKKEMKRIIGSITVYNPNVIAEYVLQEALDNIDIKDDISLLVGVVWENNN